MCPSDTALADNLKLDMEMEYTYAKMMVLENKLLIHGWSLMLGIANLGFLGD